MPFYRQMLTLTWAEHVINEEVLNKMETRKTYILKIRKRLKISETYYEEGRLGKRHTHRVY